MSGGYTPVFRSVFTGSLCGQWPDTAAWLSFLALADKNGEVDMTPQYISSVTGMPITDLMGCIERFMQPDPMSRSTADEGRRLELLNPDRQWGWRIVNFHFYREKARLAAKNAREVESGKNAERMAHRNAMTAADRRGPPLTDPSYAYANTVLKKPANAAEKREEGRRMWPRVLAAIQSTDLQKAFPTDSEVAIAVAMIGGWQALGRKSRDLRGQSEQQFLNAYEQLWNREVA